LRLFHDSMEEQILGSLPPRLKTSPMRSMGLVCFVNYLFKAVIVAMLRSNCLIQEAIAFALSERPSLISHIFLSICFSTSLNKDSNFKFSKLLRNAERCEHVWLGISCLAMNVNNPTALKENALYFLFKQDWKGHWKVLERVHKVCPLYHWFKFKALMLHIIWVYEFLILSK
jgi:hypothetical protein